MAKSLQKKSNKFEKKKTMLRLIWLSNGMAILKFRNNLFQSIVLSENWTN